MPSSINSSPLCESNELEEVRLNAETSSVNSVESLLSECHSLYSSICDFQSYVTSTNKDVDLHTFRNAVASELKSVQRLARSDPCAPHVEHALRSTNLPFLQAVWDTAKGCQGLTTLSKRFFPGSQSSSQSRLGMKGISVDVVAHEGLEWVKISTVKDYGLLHALARAGWESGSENEDDQAPKVSVQSPDLDYAGNLMTLKEEDKPGEIDLVRTISKLTKIAKTTKVKYRHPSVRVVLPKIVEGSQPAVDRIIRSIRATGAVVSVNYWSIHCCPIY